MQFETKIKRLLKKFKNGKADDRDFLNELKDLPYKDIGFAKVDSHRALRRGFPEVIYCRGKTTQRVQKIVAALYSKNEPLLLTKAEPELYKILKKRYKALRYNEDARIIYKLIHKKPAKKGLVLVISAGTSDIPVAEEARVTLEVMGNNARAMYDIGVAGLHRVLGNLRVLRQANVIIVVAGMEGALASVISGLTSRPIIAVPTSVGYGASFKGIAPILTMLNCCSPGVTVVNIDNGFGAGYFASLVNT